MQAAQVQVTEVVVLSDVRRLRKARAGDADAFRSILVELLPGAFRLASGIIGSEAGAADATQNAVVAAWCELPRLHDLAWFDTWFDRILVNECRMQLRRQPHVREPPGPTVPARHSGATAAAPATLKRDDVLIVLERAFERLDPDDRAMLVLHLVDNRPVTEIGAALHMPLGTVKWRLHEARQALLRALETVGWYPVDRTEELVRSMLERRAGGPPPAWLLDASMHQVLVARRARGGWRRFARMRPTAGSRVVPVAASVVLVGLLAGSALIAGGLMNRIGMPSRTQPAVVVVATPQPTPATASLTPSSATPTRTPAITPRTSPDALAADTMAVVTSMGDGLRVRSDPGLGSDSLKLTPLLAAGTRMYVLSGAVAADGYAWFQVMTQGDPWHLFGWVASGKDGETWIRPAAPGCRDPLDGRAVFSLDPIDFLLCYGDQPVELRVTAVEPQAGANDGWCEWTAKRGECVIDPAWLNPRVLLVVDGGDGSSGRVLVAVPPGLSPHLAVATRTDLIVTVGADAPDAHACRIVDATNREVVPHDRAVVECRLILTVRDVARREATGSP